MTNKNIVEKFYTAFSNKDYKSIFYSLSENIIYHDPIYGLLEGDVVRWLWQMRCERLHNASFKFWDIEALDHEYMTCQWQIQYFNNASGADVVMKGKAYMRVIDGKITEQSEGYRLSDWLAISHGWMGKLFGWTGYMQRKEKKKFAEMLNRYIKSQSLFTKPDKRIHDYDFSDQ